MSRAIGSPPTAASAASGLLSGRALRLLPGSEFVAAARRAEVVPGSVNIERRRRLSRIDLHAANRIVRHRRRRRTDFDDRLAANRCELGGRWQWLEAAQAGCGPHEPERAESPPPPRPP